MNKKYYTQKEFKKLAGINNRQRLNQLMMGYRQIKNGKEYSIPPKLKEGKDFIRAGTIFFPSALKKLKQKKK